jgi:hypothetical protein
MNTVSRVAEVRAIVGATVLLTGLLAINASVSLANSQDVAEVSVVANTAEFSKELLLGEEVQRVKIPNIVAQAASPAALAPAKVQFDGPLSEEELVSVLKYVGFTGSSLKQAWAVAMKESTGNPKAHNQNSKTGDNSYGLFQINMIGSLGPARADKYGLDSYEDLFDPYINARVAYQMSEGGTNWGPWGIGPNAYNGGTTGSYYTWLEQYPGE